MPRSKNPNPHQFNSRVEDSPNRPEFDSYSPPDIDGSDYENDEQNTDSVSATADVTENLEAALRVKTEIDDSGVFAWRAATETDADSSAGRTTNSPNADSLISSEFLVSSVKSVTDTDLDHKVEGDVMQEKADDSAIGQFSHMTLKRGTLVGKHTSHQKLGNIIKRKNAPTPLLGNHNPSILTWFRQRFTLKAGKRLSASQVIKQYEKDFSSTTDIPLLNFQVGHFLRRVFRHIERCKITHHGKRVWVYRNLCLAEENQGEPSKEGSENLPKSPLKTGGSRLVSTADVRRSTRVRRKKSFDNDFECTDETGRMSPKRKARNSGILYSLLYPPESENTGSCDTEALSAMKTSAANAKKKLILEELVLEWLRENYEYADGFHVRSLDVLRHYNRCRDAHVQHLCQIGRYIKMVFPQAKHMRKTMKEGKREWIYYNVRAKEEGSTSTGEKWTSPPIEEKARPSMVSTDIFRAKSPSLAASTAEESKGQPESFPLITLPSLPTELSSIYLDDDENPDHQKMLVPSTSTFSDTGRFTTATVSSHSDQPVVASSTYNEHRKDQAHPNRRSHLESQINRLRSNKSTFRTILSKPARVVNTPDRDNPSTGNNRTRLSVAPKIGKLWSIKTDVPVSKIKGAPAVQNRWLTTKRKVSLEGKAPGQPPGKISIIKVSLPNGELRTSQRTPSEGVVSSNSSSSSKPFTQDVYQLHNERLLLKPRQQTNVDASASKTGQLHWKDLESYKSHWSGWAFTPTRPTSDKQDYFEWVIFEGNMLCDGQRVFRELRIYDDWSVSIHVLGKKVYADEVGGITDLKRTRASIDKVMQTLAEAKLCRGFASPRLSEMRVHGVIVAKPEIWSKRLVDNEELRHRAINCQVLHRTANECCNKCTRIIQVNKHKPAGLRKLMS